jgi:hypothetical protein
MRLEMLFDPGNLIVPLALNKGGRSRKLIGDIVIEFWNGYLEFILKVFAPNDTASAYC